MNTGLPELAASAMHDRSNFVALYDRYYPRVYKYIRYRCDDEAVTEDLVAQTFEQVLRDLPRYSPDRSPFEAWLFSIARHRVSDHHRARFLHRTLPWEALHHHPSREPLPEEILMRGEAEKELLAALEHLSPRERDLLGLKFASQLSHNEIAGLTGLSESNVAVIVYRAIVRLRGFLTEIRGLGSSTYKTVPEETRNG